MTLASGEVNNDFDFGLYNLVTIGDSVWHDLDADGVQDSNESGIDGLPLPGARLNRHRNQLRQAEASIPLAPNREPTPLS